jgi:putative isomerase
VPEELLSCTDELEFPTVQEGKAMCSFILPAHVRSHITIAFVLCGTFYSWTGFAQSNNNSVTRDASSRNRAMDHTRVPVSAQYLQVQERLARGWNTWDANSVTTHVLLPYGLAIHIGMKHNTTVSGDAFLENTLIGRLEPGAEQVTPGPHSWNGSYTDLSVEWKGHKWRVQSAHDGADLVLLVEPLSSESDPTPAPTVVFSVNALWNRTIHFTHNAGSIIASPAPNVKIPIFCTCTDAGASVRSYGTDFPVGAPYFAADMTGPIGVSTGKRRTLAEIRSAIEGQRKAYEDAIASAGKNGPIVDAIETTLGWDTIYEPAGRRVISPVSRVWCVNWGGYVLFDWDTFFAATLASIGDRDLAYANAIEILREETPDGFVPNFARPGWKSYDRSEPPVGAITIIGLYRQFHERWLLEDTFAPLLRWNRWWAAHRDMQGYLCWGSNGDAKPANTGDKSSGTWQGAVYESGLDNSPMYDGTFYNPKTHLLEVGDVGLMSLYIADCDALAEIAETLHKTAEAQELRDRSARYRAKLKAMWSENEGIFLNKDLHTGENGTRLSPTNFYPLMAGVATSEQAKEMIKKHLLNPKEFWGQWIIPSIERDDPAFADQNYWRGRIWGPMNYLVYLGLRRYDDAETRRAFAQKSYELFLKEWTENRHVHENYNAILGTGDDVRNSDRFYHWGALLGYVEYLETGGAK